MRRWASLVRAVCGFAAASLVAVGVPDVVAWVPSAAAATTVCPTGPGYGSVSYTEPGEYKFSPPMGVQHVCVVAVGAFGGNYQDLGGDAPFYGGHGAFVSSWVAVPSTVYAEVGSTGSSGTATTMAAGGSPNGGAGGAGADGGGGGGGESDLRLLPMSDPGSAGSRLLVAGGGGGAGGEGTAVIVPANPYLSKYTGDIPGGNGANAFDPDYAAQGLAANVLDALPGGTGTSESSSAAGGAGGGGGGESGGESDAVAGYGPSSTSPGLGGSGATATGVLDGWSFGSGGGGGGGWAGGGGGGDSEVVLGANGIGGGGGGGGGSSWVDPTALVGGQEPAFADSFNGGVSYGSQVTISWVTPRTLEYSGAGGLKFPSQTDGVPGAPLTVTVTNGAGPALAVGAAQVGGELLHLSGVKVTGADPGDFEVSAPGCGSITAQSSCTLTVRFVARGQGDRAANLQFSSNDPTRPGPVSLTLDGTGLARTTASSVVCPPGKTTVGAALACRMTVRDTAPAPMSTPTGAVSLATNSAGAVGTPGTCTLVPSGKLGQASCSLTYTPSAVGSGRHLLTVSYDGDATHAASRSTVAVSVAMPGGGHGVPPTSQLRALLVQQLRPKGSGASIKELLTAGGYLCQFSSPEAGTLRVDWYLVPTEAPAGKVGQRPVLVASGGATFSSSGSAVLFVRLTATGRDLFEHASRLPISGQAIFTTATKGVVSARTAFTLGR